MPESAVTKRALAATLKSLLIKKPLNKITVGDICEQCGMSRKGFYYHFKDKYDLVNWIFDSEFLEAGANKRYRSSWDFLLDICTYFYDNRAFYIRAFQVEGQNSFASYFADRIQPLIERYLENAFEDDQHAHFYSVFFTDAFHAAIVRWLREDAAIEPAEFVYLLCKATSNIAEHMSDVPPVNGG